MKRPLRTGKLLDHEIPGLRQRVHSGQTTPSQEADRYGVGVETIRRAVRGETFRHITEGLVEGREPPPVAPAISTDEVEASLRRLQNLQDAEIEQRDAVDFFVEKRKEGGE